MSFRLITAVIGDTLTRRVCAHTHTHVPFSQRSGMHFLAQHNPTNCLTGFAEVSSSEFRQHPQENPLGSTVCIHSLFVSSNGHVSHVSWCLPVSLCPTPLWRLERSELTTRSQKTREPCMPLRRGQRSVIPSPALGSF